MTKPKLLLSEYVPTTCVIPRSSILMTVPSCLEPDVSEDTRTMTTSPCIAVPVSFGGMKISSIPGLSSGVTNANPFACPVNFREINSFFAAGRNDCFSF